PPGRVPTLPALDFGSLGFISRLLSTDVRHGCFCGARNASTSKSRAERGSGESPTRFPTEWRKIRRFSRERESPDRVLARRGSANIARVAVLRRVRAHGLPAAALGSLHELQKR